MVAIEDLTEGDSQHLTALIEDRLDDTTEQLLVATKVGDLITRHADDGTLNLGRRIEDTGFDGEFN